MTRDQIKHLILTDDRAVARALLTLLARQTSEEQSTFTTRNRNGQGFNAFHAGRGTYFANWVADGRQLSGHHLDAARKMVLYYVGQLEEVTKDKLRANMVHLTHESFSLSKVDPFINDAMRDKPRWGMTG